MGDAYSDDKRGGWGGGFATKSKTGGKGISEWRKEKVRVLSNMVYLHGGTAFRNHLDATLQEAEERARREEREACAKIAEEGAFCNCSDSTMRHSPCNACHRRMEASAIAKEIRARENK